MSKEDSPLSKEGNEIMNQLAKLLNDLDWTYGTAKQRTDLFDTFIKELDKRNSWDGKAVKDQMKEVALQAKATIMGEKLILSMIGLATSQVLRLLVLVEQKHDVEIQIPANIEKELKLWTANMEAARKAWSQYIK